MVLIFWHLRPGYLADTVTPSRRAVYRFFRDTKREGASVILLSIADWRATRGAAVDRKKRVIHERIMFNLLKDYFRQKTDKPLKKIVDGYDIMGKFNLPPSPVVGKILKKIREEQALGNISTKKKAYGIARDIINRETRKQI